MFHRITLSILICTIFSVVGINAQQPFITTWKTDNPGSSCSSCIEIPTSQSVSFLNYTYSYDIDWENDGVFDLIGVTGNVTHDYGSPGSYDVAIRGNFPHMYINNYSDRSKLVDIKQWGDIIWQDMVRSYRGAENLNISAIDSPNLSQVTDMEEMFRGASSLNSNLNSWDVSNITDMEAMFSGASIFNSNLNSWDVTSVTTMDNMFRNAINFNSDITTWDMSNVSRITSIFSGASSFNQDIGNWDCLLYTSDAADE